MVLPSLYRLTTSRSPTSHLHVGSATFVAIGREWQNTPVICEPGAEV
jgi:hypothetical protein